MGALQKSVLGAILLNIFIKDLEKVLHYVPISFSNEIIPKDQLKLQSVVLPPLEGDRRIGFWEPHEKGSLQRYASGKQNPEQQLQAED